MHSLAHYQLFSFRLDQGKTQKVNILEIFYGIGKNVIPEAEYT